MAGTASVPLPTLLLIENFRLGHGFGKRFAVFESSSRCACKHPPRPGARAKAGRPADPPAEISAAEEGQPSTSRIP